MLLGAATARVEEMKGVVMGRERDQFPVGMRVLAVDDDPVCLKVLETLLRRCQYHVTTTNQAITALKLLREHRDMFDLVISDVHMPDMDGFKLLELVGLEMDLPVIMLSVNGETKSVMKGITHGACDYLVKPVRIEELRNIWQHVVRRKFSSRECGNLDIYKESLNADLCHGHSQIVSRASDQGGRLSKKRKEMHSEEEDDSDGNDFQEGDEPSASKKPRVVWSVELHRKFVAAVNQLGIDKAVPKRILELMNVEKLTRENVASHLQKYRLYLKRLSVVASQQASIVAAFGGRDPSFLHMGTFEGLQSYQPFASSTALPSFNSHDLLSSTSTYGVPELASDKIVQNVTNNGILSHCAGDTNKFQLVSLQEKHQANLSQGLTTSLGLAELQQQWIHQGNNDLSPVFSGGALVNNMPDTLQRVTSTPLLSQELVECTQAKVTVQPSLRMSSVSSDMVERTVGVSANLQNSSLSQQGALTRHVGFSADLFDGTDATKIDTSFVPLQSGTDQASNFLVGMPVCLSDSIAATNNSKCEAGSSGSTILLPPDTGRHSNYLQFGIASNSRNKMDGIKQDRMHNQGLSSGSSNHNFGACMTEQANATVPLIPQMNVHTVTPEDKAQSKNTYDLGMLKLHGGFNSSSCNFDSLLNSIIKTEADDLSFADNDLGCDFFPLGACI